MKRLTIYILRTFEKLNFNQGKLSNMPRAREMANAFYKVKETYLILLAF